MDLEDHLSRLKLEMLPDSWVQEVWEQEFMDDIPLPSDYEFHLENEHGFYKYIFKLTKYLKRYICNDDETDTSESSNSWKNLINIVAHEKLVAFLFSMINKGDAEVSSKECLLRAVYASRLYMVMLSIPGSKAFKIFHCQMFVVCLKIFRFGDKLIDCESFFNDSKICSHINELNENIIDVLNDLSLLIDKFDLKSNNVCIEETVNALVDMANNVQMNYRQYINKELLGSISENSFKCLSKLIKNSSEVPDKNILMIVFKFVLPKFIFSEKTSKKIMLSYRTGGIVYCGMLLRDFNDFAIDGFKCLIQHLSYNTVGMERAENRSFKVNTIFRLLCLLPLEPYTDLINWIVQLSKNSQPALRSIALDIIGLVITGKDEIPSINETGDFVSNNDADNDGEEADSQNSQLSSQFGDVGHKDLLKVIVERCQDVGPTVRTKALAILVSCTSAENEKLHTLLRELYKNGDVLMSVVEDKSKDERVIVRVAAIKLLDNLLKSREEFLVKKNLQLLVERCRDTSVQVRSISITTLTNLAIFWNNASIADAWLDGVLNQLSDTESKIQDMVSDGLYTLVIANLSDYNIEACSPKLRMPWILLNAVIRKNMRRHLNRACLMISKRRPEILSKIFIYSLISHVRTENNTSCWVLLSCIARFIRITDIAFVIDYFNELTADTMLEDIKLLVLVQEVLCEWCSCLSNEQSLSLREQVLQNLQFNMIPSGATRGAVSLAVRLTRDNDYSWASNLMKEYEDKILIHTNANGLMNDVGGSIIITFADIALASDTKPSNDIITLLISTVRSFEMEDNYHISESTLAAAVAALGKLSLRDISTAVKTTKLCTKLLTSPSCPLPIKINSMCTLADTSTRYATMVEPMLSGMNACLTSSDLTIRRMAVQLLTQLLVSDFLKLKGVLFFHYLSLLCDEDEKIKDTAIYFIFQCLIIKDKSILYNNFVKTVFYFNNFHHPLYHEKYDVTDEEKEFFSMQGDDKRSNRFTIYDMMLSHMTDVQLLNTQVRLCHEVLGAAEMEDVNTNVLRDSLDVLRKLSSYKQSKEQNNDLVTRVTSNIVAQKMKLNDIEKVVPMVMRLYRQLKSMNSPLVSSVLGYACDLLKNYKQEVEDIMDQDEDLLNEIKKFRANPDSSDENDDSQIGETPAKEQIASTSGMGRKNSSTKKNQLSVTPRRRSAKVRRVLLSDDD